MSSFTRENYRAILNSLIYIIQRAAEVFELAQNWYQQHKDTISAYLSIFAELSYWFSAVQKMADAQIVFTGDLSFDLAQQICQSDNVTATVEQFYTENNDHEINIVIARCRQATQTSAYSELFSQTISAYQHGHYHLACLGMFSIIDGMLSDISENKITSFKTRIKQIEKKIEDKFELTDLEKKLLCIYVAMDNFEESIFNFSDFKDAEPDALNRHWVVHGRTRREYTKVDFIKTILWLDAIIFLDDKLSTMKG